MPILNCPIRANAIATPNAIAIYLPTATITYAQLDHIVNQGVSQLQQQGVGLSDEVAFYTTDKLTLVVSLFACIRLGAIFCPLSQYLPDNEVEKLLSQTGISYLHHANGLKTQGVTCIKIRVEHPNKDKQTPSVKKEQKQQLKTKKEHSQNRETLHLEQINLNGASPATIIFTSGSTGQPKAAVHSLNNHYYSAKGSQSVIPLNRKDCWLASLPLYHVGGLAIVMRCFIAQASIALVDSKDLFSSLQQHPISHVSLVPTQLYRLLEQCEQYKLAQSPLSDNSSETLSNTSDDTSIGAISLRFLLLGGAPISRSLLEQASAFGFNAFHSYGLTEMCSQVATSPAKNPYFSMPLPARQWKLVNGELAVRGKTLFLGYLVKGEIHPACRQGWFYTKDLAESSDKGVKIIGRKDNMFIVGGENYQPEVIEKIIIASPLVENALIVGIKDDEFGKIPVAFINWAASANTQALKEYLTAKISRIQIPKHFILWPEQTTQTLKPNRKKMQLQAQQIAIEEQILADNKRQH